MPTTRAGHAYHHGSLRAALIAATRSLLTERGADGFSLREVARRAGVTAAAPAHHFGDATGLLTAVAAQGFAELTQRLAEGQARGRDGPEGLREQGVEYVRFALEQPGLFRLMFRSGQLRDDELLTTHGFAAYCVLADGVVRASRQPQTPGDTTPGDMTRDELDKVTALWSLVHGYAHLAIAGKLGTDAGQDDCPAEPRLDALGPGLLERLRPVLDAVLAGLFPPLQPPRSRARRHAAG
jgi:AcrR family transcriptional regulator